MKYLTLLFCFTILSSLCLANNGFVVNDIQAKVTRIDYVNQTIEYEINNKKTTLKLDQDVISRGYYDKNSQFKNIKSLSLNKHYFLRIIQEDSFGNKSLGRPERYVKAISTVIYNELF